MSQTDIALLLADAADEVEIGIAPVQVVMRAGRRRRARRWAVAAATAVVLAGSTGATLAFGGLPGHGDRGVNTAKPPSSPEARHVYDPQETRLSRGVYKGKRWDVDIQVWGAPRNVQEATRQFDTLTERWLDVAGATKPADLIGKISYFVIKKYGTDSQQILFDSVNKLGHMSGRDLESGTVPMSATGAGSGGDRLIVGQVAKTAQEVTCHWKDGTTTVVKKGPVDPAIVPADGFPAANWFVCMAPEGTTAQSAEVTK